MTIDYPYEGFFWIIDGDVVGIASEVPLIIAEKHK